jgi:MFS family permease
LAGWASDRFFGGRRAPMVCLLMVVLGSLTLVYDAAIHSTVSGSMLLLVVIGFAIYGPQVLLVGTAPADLAHRGTSAAAAGFVNFMGYLGAATGDVVTGYYSAPQHGGWQVAIYIWAGWAFAGAAIMAILWNTTSRKVGVLPSAVPKLGALAALAVAGAAVDYGGQPLGLYVATFAAAICAMAAWRTRWAAVPALLLAAAGLATVFITYVRDSSGITWDQTVAMVAYGLTMLATLMILVDRKGAACE